MTAELFVKLSFKIYADRKRHEDFDSDPDGSSPYYLANEHSSLHSPSGQELNGGARLSTHSSEGDLLDLSVQTSVGTHSMAMNDNLPSSWHANQQQKLNMNDCNPFSVLQNADNAGEANGSEDEDSGMEHEGRLTQWIPKMESSFWDLYANKLRVNASEGGVCDLNEQFE